MQPSDKRASELLFLPGEASRDRVPTFLNLPRELRDEIYSYLFCRLLIIPATLHDGGRTSRNGVTAILRVCRTIRAEATQAFFDWRYFEMTIEGKGIMFFGQFLRMDEQPSEATPALSSWIRHLRNVAITIPAYNIGRETVTPATLNLASRIRENSMNIVCALQDVNAIRRLHVELNAIEEVEPRHQEAALEYYLWPFRRIRNLNGASFHIDFGFFEKPRSFEIAPRKPCPRHNEITLASIGRGSSILLHTVTEMQDTMLGRSPSTTNHEQRTRAALWSKLYRWYFHDFCIGRYKSNKKHEGGKDIEQLNTRIMITPPAMALVWKSIERDSLTLFESSLRLMFSEVPEMFNGTRKVVDGLETLLQIERFTMGV